MYERNRQQCLCRATLENEWKHVLHILLSKQGCLTLLCVGTCIMQQDRPSLSQCCTAWPSETDAVSYVSGAVLPLYPALTTVCQGRYNSGGSMLPSMQDWPTKVVPKQSDRIRDVLKQCTKHALQGLQQSYSTYFMCVQIFSFSNLKTLYTAGNTHTHSLEDSQNNWGVNVQRPAKWLIL